MTTPPIATSSFLRRWRRLHRRETGEVLLRHAHLARTLALASMSPQQVAIVTAYLAQVERAFCCESVAEHVAASLRPDLFAHVIRDALFDGHYEIPRVPADLAIGDVEKAIIRRAKSLGDKTTTTPSRKKA